MKGRSCMYVTVAVAVAAWAIATLLGLTNREHDILLRTNGKGEEIPPDMRGIPVAPEGNAKYVRSKASNLWLHRQFWEPDGGMEKARAIVVYAHGYAEYSGRFYDVPNYLTHHGIAVAMQDSEGHGRSEGNKVLAPSFLRLVEDYTDFIKDVKAAHPGLPIICSGQSMGSMIAGVVAENDARLSKEDALCDAVVLMGFAGQGTMERLVRKVPLVKDFFGVLAAVLPRLPLMHLNTLDELSTSEADCELWVKDPYDTTQRLLAVTGTQLLEGQLLVSDNAANITAPLLILHGSDDSIGLPGGPRELFAHVSTPEDKKKMLMLEGSHHCVLMEPKYKDQVLEEFKEFVLKNAAKDVAEP